MTTFVLVPGMWLGGWAWRPVVARLRAAGHEAYPLSLTGLAERAHLAGPQTDLETHVTDILALLAAEDLTDVVLVGHSYGGGPVTVAADRCPERLGHVVYVDSGPYPDGTAQIDFDPSERDRIREQVGDGWRVPVPDFDPDAGTGPGPALLAGLTAGHREAMRRRGTPHPYGTITAPVRLSGGRPVPTTLIACTMPPDGVRAMIAAGHPFFAGAAGADLVPLPTGHWPMFSEPERLAALLGAIVPG
jgi:pimeloyl-ACP methyl ester carboxylesterase